MTAQTDLIAWVNQNGARIRPDPEDPTWEVLVVGAGADGKDVILATPEWQETEPAAFPLHKYSGPVTATETGWTARINDGSNETISIDRIDDGMPEIQDAWTQYQSYQPVPGATKKDLQGY
jgi:hypothetical protein